MFFILLKKGELQLDLMSNIVDIIDDVYSKNNILYIHLIDQTRNNFLDKYISINSQGNFLNIDLSNTRFGLAITESILDGRLVFSLGRFNIINETINGNISITSKMNIYARIMFNQNLFTGEFLMSRIDEVVVINGMLNNKNEIIPKDYHNYMTETSLVDNIISLISYSIIRITIEKELYTVNCFINNYTETSSGSVYSPMLVISGDLPKQIYQYLPLKDHVFNLNGGEGTTKIKSINKPFLEYGIDTSGDNASLINLSGVDLTN